MVLLKQEPGFNRTGQHIIIHPLECVVINAFVRYFGTKKGGTKAAQIPPTSPLDPCRTYRNPHGEYASTRALCWEDAKI